MSEVCGAEVEHLVEKPRSRGTEQDKGGCLRARKGLRAVGSFHAVPKIVAAEDEKEESCVKCGLKECHGQRADH